MKARTVIWRRRVHSGRVRYALQPCLRLFQGPETLVDDIRHARDLCEWLTFVRMGRSPPAFRCALTFVFVCDVDSESRRDRRIV